MSWHEEALRLYKPGEFGPAKIGKQLGVKADTVKTFLHRAKRRGEVHKVPTADNIDNMVADEKKRLQEQNQRKILTEMIQQQARRDIIAEKMISAIQALPELNIKPLKINPKQQYSEVEAVLMLSDIQAGTYISSETTGGLNEYNKDILAKQFKVLKYAICSLVTKMKLISPIRKLNIHALGDMVEGMGIFVGQAQHTDQDLYNQMFFLAEQICKLLVELLGLFDEIEFTGVGGNHGRIGKKGENPHWVNWDVYLYKYLEARLQNYKRIKFNIPLSWWYLDTIQGHNFLLLHGDDIKAWNGLPYYGIDRADAKWTKLLNSKNLRYDYIELGHFHQPTELPSVAGEKFINGCWPGGSIFALKNLVTANRPVQKFFVVHPEKGAIWRNPIWLDFFDDMEG